MPIAFTDFFFLILIGISFIVYWSLGNHPKYQNIALLCTCYFFYSWIDFWISFVIAISTIYNYYTGILLGKDYNQKVRKFIITFSVLANVAYLIVFKYFDFFSTQTSNILALFYLEVDPILLNILLPIGISFYTLQVIAYNIDVYRKNIDVCTDFINFAVFVAYFPKLTAGPIEHPKNILPKIEKEKKIEDTDFRGAFQLIIIGYFKKIVLASLIARQIGDVYSNPYWFSSMEIRLAIFLYTMQIYLDFTSYSDIARGVSRLFGIDLMINFNQPYLAKNIQEFWRTWHISLSEWFRDYVYFPLGGSRKSKPRLMLNLMIIFVLSGIWHGVGVNFIIWGFLHGLFIVIYRINTILIGNWKMNHQDYIAKFNKEANIYNLFAKLYKLVGWFITFQLVAFAWIFFRTPDFDTAALIIYRAYFLPIELNADILMHSFFVLLLFACICSFAIDIAQKKLGYHEIFTKAPWIIKGIIYAIIILMILLFLNIFIEVEPFIYQGF